MSDLSSVAVPVDLIRCAFEDSEPNSVRVAELQPLIPSIVLQAVADGRISVYLNSAIVTGTIRTLAESFLSYFERFHTHATYTAGRQTLPVEGSLELPHPCNSLKLSITGFFQCTALFAIVPQVPRDINCPVLLVGFPSPRQAERLEREFEEFCGKRDFPCLDLKAIARQRVRLESRNRDYLIQTTRMRQALEDRYARADELLQKREQQMEMLTKEAEAIIRAREAPQPPHRTPLVERTIDRIDRAINEITAYVGRLAETANGKSEGRPMTRKEELALLERLKNEVRETRQQLDALNEQLS